MHNYFHLPAEYVIDSSALAAHFEIRGLPPKHDTQSGWMDLSVNHRIVRLIPRSSRVFANLVIAVDPDIKTDTENDTAVLEPVFALLAEIGGQAATNDYHLELDFIGSRLSSFETPCLFQEQNRSRILAVSDVLIFGIGYVER